MSEYISTRLPAPAKPSPSMWVDEAIWGHRYHDEQNPWLTFLEFLNVFAHEKSKGRALEEINGYNTLSYTPARRLQLRNLLFNNPKIDNIAEQDVSDEFLWKEWQQQLQNIHGAIDPNFEYLKERFNGPESFKDFAEITALLRSTGLELNTNKRWSSKFVFPYGTDCLYEDLNKDAKTNDRNFFGRTGEMLYLILCRSKKRNALRSLFGEHLIFQNSNFNKLAKALQPEDGETSSSQLKDSFLPYTFHPSYDALAEDWVALLELQMPGYDVIPHMVNIAALHLLQYQLRVAQNVANKPNPLRMVCEIVAPKKTLVRELSCDDYQQNNLLSTEAVTAYIDAIEQSEKWQQAKQQPGAFVTCKNMLEEQVRWGSDYSGASTPDELIKTLREDAKRRHKQHVANVHRTYGKDIGLVSRRGTVKLRYAPNDGFLKCLIFSNVVKRMELHQFLSLMWTRYGLIFGDKEAESVMSSDVFDKKSFQSNARRLEQRLTSLGLVKRLSDGCAYILNPHSSK